MYYEPYEDERPRWWLAVAAIGAVLVILLAVFALRQSRSDSDSDGTVSTTSSEGTTSTTVSGETASAADATTPGATATASVVAETPVSEADTPARVGTDPTAASTTSPIDSAAATTASTEPGVAYPTGPDGTPLPIVVIYDTDTITMSGQVPSDAAAARLSELAVANSQFPEAELVDNTVVNRAVPISVGVRVIELNSARFPEGTADILPEHAAELDRVVNIMRALPQISVLVIGHADQRGDDVSNFATSDERARAVVNYLRYLGISPTRLSSRAAGESDLLSLDDDEASLALNRRTEFVFYGLLIE